jgi:hypothetical protein
MSNVPRRAGTSGSVTLLPPTARQQAGVGHPGVAGSPCVRTSGCPAWRRRGAGGGTRGREGADGAYRYGRRGATAGGDSRPAHETRASRSVEARGTHLPPGRERSFPRLSLSSATKTRRFEALGDVEAAPYVLQRRQRVQTPLLNAGESLGRKRGDESVPPRLRVSQCEQHGTTRVGQTSKIVAAWVGSAVETALRQEG